MATIKIQNRHTKVVSEIDSKLWEEKKARYSKHFIVLTTEIPKVIKELEERKKSSKNEKKEDEVKSPESSN